MKLLNTQNSFIPASLTSLAPPSLNQLSSFPNSTCLSLCLSSVRCIRAANEGGHRGWEEWGEETREKQGRRQRREGGAANGSRSKATRPSLSPRSLFASVSPHHRRVRLIRGMTEAVRPSLVTTQETFPFKISHEFPFLRQPSPCVLAALRGRGNAVTDSERLQSN